jgi:hypothetical protein
MSETIQQVDELRSRAIGLLLAERSVIDERLRLFGYDGTMPVSKQKVCSLCGDGSHNARTCPNKKGAEAPAIRSAAPSEPGASL